MKSANPMAQLEQWKKNNALKIEPVTKSKFGLCEKTQLESRSEPKKKYQGKLSINPLAFKLAQMTRQFEETSERKIALANVTEKSGEFPKIYDTPHDPNNCTKNNPHKFAQIEKTQLESRSEPKKKYQGKLSFNPLAFKLTQLTRQFKLIQESNQKCFDVYPDDFHHKLKFRGELVDISDRLKAGGKLLNQLAKMQGVTFTRDNQTTLREFNQANGYLLTKFKEVIEQIDKLNIEFVERENAPKDLKDS